jgi:hypothetical protein
MKRGTGWKEQRCGGTGDEGVGQVKGQDIAKFGMGTEGWAMEIS